MKIFANENLFEPIIDYLRSLGNDVLSIRDSGLSGISDDEVFERACTVDETLTIFKKYYQPIKEEDIKGNLVIISPEGVRIRRSTR